MNPRTKNLVMAGGAVVVVGFVAVSTLVPAPPRPAAGEPSDAATVGSPLPSPGYTEAAAGPAPSPVASPSGTPTTAPGPGRRSYAVGLHDLAGFPPDAAPGARLELWVTWEPPITDEPRLQKLIGDVLLERTIPGSVPEAPVSVLLSVPAERVGDLMYADAFGQLGVTLMK